MSLELMGFGVLKKNLKKKRYSRLGLGRVGWFRVLVVEGMKGNC
jgi:hypothetical protein